MEKPVLDGLYSQKWYNDRELTDDQTGYVLFENKLLGSPRLRQLRVSFYHLNSSIFNFQFSGNK